MNFKYKKTSLAETNKASLHNEKAGGLLLCSMYTLYHTTLTLSRFGGGLYA